MTVLYRPTSPKFVTVRSLNSLNEAELKTSLVQNYADLSKLGCYNAKMRNSRLAFGEDLTNEKTSLLNI